MSSPSSPRIDHDMNHPPLHSDTEGQRTHLTQPQPHAFTSLPAATTRHPSQSTHRRPPPPGHDASRIVAHHSILSDDPPLMTATMYAPYHYTFHDPSAVGPGQPPPPPPGAYGQPPYPHPGDMHADPNAIHHPHHPHHPHHLPHPQHGSPPTAPRLPALQVHLPGSSKLRSRREMDSPSIKSAPPLINTANMTPEEEAAAREEARKARKREMGRERQRRKRLRDKAKREAEKARERMEAAGRVLEGTLHPSAQGMPFDTVRPTNTSRASLSSLSVGSYDSAASSISGYSNLPPISVNVPANSFAMSASSTSYSDTSSPSQTFSPTLSASNSLSGFTSDSSSWNEHTAVFSNLSLSGDQDATVRAKAPRASLGNFARRPSDPDYPTRRRKSDLDGEHPQIGLGVMDWQTRAGSSSKQRRPVSVPDGIVLESVHPPSRSPSPPALNTDMSAGDYRSPYNAASPEGMYFANSVVQGLNHTQWGDMLHTKLGIQQQDLDRMSPDFAGVYDRWRVENNMTQYILDPDTRAHVLSQQSSPPVTSPRTGAFVTPNPPRRDERPTSSASSASFNAPSGTMHLGQAHPATPQSRHGQSSAATSPVNPDSLHTPAGQSQSMFPPAEYGHQWSSATAPQLSRPYDPEWQGGNFSHTLSSPMTGEPKDGFPIPPPPAHGGPGQPMAIQTNFVSGAEFSPSGPSDPPRSAGPYTPATPLQRGPNVSGPSSAVPLYYNPQFHPQPVPNPVPGSSSQPLPPREGDMFVQQ